MRTATSRLSATESNSALRWADFFYSNSRNIVFGGIGGYRLAFFDVSQSDIALIGQVLMGVMVPQWV